MVLKDSFLGFESDLLNEDMVPLLENPSDI